MTQTSEQWTKSYKVNECVTIVEVGQSYSGMRLIFNLVFAMCETLCPVYMLSFQYLITTLKRNIYASCRW